MDVNTIATAGLSSTGVAIVLILYKVFQAIKGKRLVSDCCGKQSEVGFDVKEFPPTPPTTEKVSVVIEANAVKVPQGRSETDGVGSGSTA